MNRLQSQILSRARFKKKRRWGKRLSVFFETIEEETRLTAMSMLTRKFWNYVTQAGVTFGLLIEANDYDSFFKDVLGVEIALIHWSVAVLWIIALGYFAWRGFDGFYRTKDFHKF